MKNKGDSTLSIIDVELLADAPGAVVDDVRVLDTGDAAPGTLIGTAHGFSPPAAAGPARGAVLRPSSGQPGRAYQLLFAVRATAEGGTLFRGLRITYRTGGRRYIRATEDKLRICTPRGVRCEVGPP
jgi:hypothetical protein